MLNQNFKGIPVSSPFSRAKGCHSLAIQLLALLSITKYSFQERKRRERRKRKGRTKLFLWFQTFCSPSNRISLRLKVAIKRCETHTREIWIISEGSRQRLSTLKSSATRLKRLTSGCWKVTWMLRNRSVNNSQGSWKKWSFS